MVVHLVLELLNLLPQQMLVKEREREREREGGGGRRDKERDIVNVVE